MDDKMSNKHVLTLCEREKLMVTGVEDVFAFDEEMIDIETDMGMLNIKGMELHITKLNLDKGELAVEGEIESLTYHEDGPAKRGNSFLGKLFK